MAGSRPPAAPATGKTFSRHRRENAVRPHRPANLGDRAVHFPNVTAMHVRNLGSLPSCSAIICKLTLLVGQPHFWLRLGGQMVARVALDQVRKGRRLPALALLTGWVAAPVDLLRSSMARSRAAATDQRGNAPMVCALPAIEPVVEENDRVPLA